jgi:sugar phosphate isomerase/epimerase
MYTLADFGNWPEEADRYASLTKIMPFAAAVHAKVNDIDENLNHPRFDHRRCIQIAKDAGYTGYLGIEYEGKDDPVLGIGRGARLLRSILGK